MTPALNLRASDEEKELYNKGFIFDKSAEILTKGHMVNIVANMSRSDKMAERATVSDFLFPLNRWPFMKNVRIMAYCGKFLSKFKSIKKKLQADQAKFSAFQVNESALQTFGVSKPGLNIKGNPELSLSEDDLSWALEYFYKRGTKEVKQFHKPEFLKKISIEKDCILFCKSRIHQGERFQLAGGLKT